MVAHPTQELSPPANPVRFIAMLVSSSLASRSIASAGVSGSPISLSPLISFLDENLLFLST